MDHMHLLTSLAHNCFDVIPLQYLGSRGLVNVDWKSMASRYERTIDSYAGTGSGSRLQRVGGRLVDFLLADFPQRSAFLAGIVLGLRIG